MPDGLNETEYSYVDYPGTYIAIDDRPLFLVGGEQYRLLVRVPDFDYLDIVSPNDIYLSAVFESLITGEQISAFGTYPEQLAKNVTPDDLFRFVAYQAISGRAVEMGLPEGYLNTPEVAEYIGRQAVNFTRIPQAKGEKQEEAFIDMDSIVEISQRIVDDPAFRTQMKAAGLFGTPTQADITAAQGGQVTGGGGEPGAYGTPIKFAEELGEGIVTPTSATVVAQSREEAEKLGATWWVPDAPGIREIYKTKKEEYEGLLAQGYSMAQTPDEIARSLSIEGAKPVQVGLEPPSLTQQFSVPVVTQKRQEWESLKKKARSAQMASRPQRTARL